ncbi:hypothetical protein A9P82_03275 [Arachidicoccus ginsenosidimutans]|uniref:polysaccharide biosynthesis C-terminal domain-containing protein n=1 Tax=Arachidicoccus sp. BS20 TaxID=1850526 RepID=UPI0007F113D6|nr:polysaccharide biosynthesis C-terminal domain-containing protein [Arachidicoccus sp. BS20]ANI88408.1 hypothetical protein A9P82_03275 [Arachidicoccus sp. BS20]
MGIVRKQSTYSTIFIYIGFAIGAVNMLVLLPKLPQDASGLTRMVNEVALVFSGFATLGSLNVLYKFYPFYRSYLKPEKNDLPFLTLTANLIGCILFILVSIFFKGFIQRKFGESSPLFVAHYHLIVPYTISYLCLMLLESFCWIIRKTIISNIARELIFRLTSSVLILLYIFKIISLNTFFELFSFSYVPSLIVLLYCIFKNGTIKICTQVSSATKRLYKRMLVFMSVHYSGALISIIPNAIDGIFIAGIAKNGLETLFVYTMAVYLVSVIEVPQRTIIAITTPLIGEAWKNKDKGKIAELYQKTSLNLLILGLALFSIIELNIDNLIRFEGSSYALIKPVFLIIGMGKLIDLGMGMNAQILGLSKYWRFDFYTSASFIAVNVLLDFFMIKTFGPIGAAYGRSIALVFYNLMRFFYLWKLYNLQPFSSKTLMTLVFGAIALIVAYIIPYVGNMFVDVTVRTTVFLLLYIPLILRFKVSEDINAMYKTALNKFLKKN